MVNVGTAGEAPTPPPLPPPVPPPPPPPPPPGGEQPRAVAVANTGAPPFRISPRREFDKRWLKMLVYGQPGAGKSTLMGSSVDVESMRDVLLIDAESGDLVLENNPRIKASAEIEHIRVTNFIQVAQVQAFLKSHCAKRDTNDEDGLRKVEAWLKGVDPSEIVTPRRFKTIIIDSLTEIEAYCMYGLMKVNEGELLTGAADEVGVARFDEFRKQNMMVQVLVRALRDLPMHVLFVCAQAYTKDEASRFHYGPSMTGKLATQIQGFVDIIGFLRTGQQDETGKAPRRLYVQPIDKFDAKNRRASFKGAYFEDPTFTTIMKELGLT